MLGVIHWTGVLQAGSDKLHPLSCHYSCSGNSQKVSKSSHPQLCNFLHFSHWYIHWVLHSAIITILCTFVLAWSPYNDHNPFCNYTKPINRRCVINVMCTPPRAVLFTCSVVSRIRWKGIGEKIGKGNFNIPKSILDLIYTQALLWWVMWPTSPAFTTTCVASQLTQGNVTLHIISVIGRHLLLLTTG